MNLFKKIKEKIKNVGINKRHILLIVSIFFSSCSFISAQIISKGSFYAKYNWIFLLFLPFHILCIILAIKFKKYFYKTTFCIIICSFFCLHAIAFGFWAFAYSYDYSLVDEVEKKVNISLPDTGYIQINRVDISTDKFRYNFISNVTFTDEDEIKTFEKNIVDSDKWTNNPNDDMDIMEGFFYQKSSNIYHLLYIVETEEYNALPNESGIYTIYNLQYNIDENELSIFDYRYIYN